MNLLNRSASGRAAEARDRRVSRVGDREGEAIARDELARSQADMGNSAGSAGNSEGMRALAQSIRRRLAQLQIHRASCWCA